jgi:hypothetical protein
VRVVDGFVEAQALGDLLIGRIAKHHVAAADQHGHVRDGHVELVQQILDAAVPLEVDVRVRMAVASQELLDAERSGAMAGSDEHDVSEPVRDQLQATKDESPHQDLAELGVGLHERQQVFAIQLDHFARLTGARVGQRVSARKHVDLARELTGAVDRDEPLGRAGSLNELDLTCRDHEERHVPRPELDEHVAALDATRAPVCGNAPELRIRQRRKYLVVARTKDR